MGFGPTKRTVVAAMLMMIVGAGASGATIVQSDSWSFPVADGTQTLTFQQFDDLGATRTLTRVTLTIDATLYLDATAENDSDLDAPDFALNVFGGTLAEGPTGTDLQADTGILYESASQSLSASDGVTGSGPDYHDFDPLLASASVDDSITSNLSSFIGTGGVDITVNDSTSAYSASGTTDATIVATEFLNYGDATLTYEYVPEPGTVGLLLIGSAIVLRRRRKSVSISA